MLVKEVLIVAACCFLEIIGGSVITCPSSIAVIQNGELTSTCEVLAEGDNNSSSSDGVSWRCENLQAALSKMTDIRMALRPEDASSCIRVDVPTGRHVITAPVDFGNASVAFVGAAEGSTGPPTIHCNYTVDVDPDLIFDPEYIYVDFTMSFSGSEYVSFDGVELVGCSYPLRLERVRTVAIRNSTFQ